MNEIEKEEVCHLEARRVNIRWKNLIFHLYTLFTSIKKILWICWAVALPSTKQIVHVNFYS